MTHVRNEVLGTTMAMRAKGASAFARQMSATILSNNVAKWRLRADYLQQLYQLLYFCIAVALYCAARRTSGPAVASRPR